MRHPEAVFRASTAHVPSPRTVVPSLRTCQLEMCAHARSVGRGLLDADACKMMACRSVASAVICVARSSDPAVHAAYRSGHWTFLSRAGHRKRRTEDQRKLQILGETLSPAVRSGFALAVTDQVYAVGVAGSQIGELDTIRLGRRSCIVLAKKNVATMGKIPRFRDSNMGSSKFCCI